MKSIVPVFVCCIFVFSVILPLCGQEEQESRDEKKKLSYEISLGIGRVNPQELYSRSTGIDELVSQYSSHYKIGFDSTGEFKQNKMMIPLNFTVNYPLKEKLYLRGGLEYAFSNSSSEKEYEFGFFSNPETQDYTLSYKVSYIMPQVGVGYRISDKFDIYGSLGIGFASFTYTEDFDARVGSDSLSSSTVYKGSGTAPGIILGLKYKVPLKIKNSKKISVFAKLESLVLSAGSLKGSKTFGPVGSINEAVPDGTVYNFEWNPFLRGGFDFWDIFETEPTGADKRNVQKMKLNLSSIRLMIGISF